MEIRDQFLSKIRPIKRTGCHHWKGAIYLSGYGAFWFKNQQRLAHRAAYELFVGPIPEGLCVLHQCDNRKCVNPAHLRVGTQKDNSTDAMQRTPKWGHIPFSKVQKARELAASGMSQRKVATMIGVSQAQISKYVTYQDRVLR